MQLNHFIFRQRFYCIVAIKLFIFEWQCRLQSINIFDKIYMIFCKCASIDKSLYIVLPWRCNECCYRSSCRTTLSVLYDKGHTYVRSSNIEFNRYLVYYHFFPLLNILNHPKTFHFQINFWKAAHFQFSIYIFSAFNEGFFFLKIYCFREIPWK